MQLCMKPLMHICGFSQVCQKEALRASTMYCSTQTRSVGRTNAFALAAHTKAFSDLTMARGERLTPSNPFLCERATIFKRLLSEPMHPARESLLVLGTSCLSTIPSPARAPVPRGDLAPRPAPPWRPFPESRISVELLRNISHSSCQYSVAEVVSSSSLLAFTASRALRIAAASAAMVVSNLPSLPRARMDLRRWAFVFGPTLATSATTSAGGSSPSLSYASFTSK
mmetsp:Transcript_10442/g.19841  ORF Transcript_10442/g.19841 Transcript_10442/m.19841 type:complete len:226 (+) Transcript_10442:110-787(+)